MAPIGAVVALAKAVIAPMRAMAAQVGAMCAHAEAIAAPMRAMTALGGATAAPMGGMTAPMWAARAPLGAIAAQAEAAAARSAPPARGSRNLALGRRDMTWASRHPCRPDGYNPVFMVRSRVFSRTRIYDGIFFLDVEKPATPLPK